jgi:hypothetical protein
MIKYKNAGFKMEGQPQQGSEQQQIDNSLGGGLGGGAELGGAPPMGGAELGGAPPMGGAELGGGAAPEAGGAGGAGFLSEEIIKKTNELDKLLKE